MYYVTRIHLFNLLLKFQYMKLHWTSGGIILLLTWILNPRRRDYCTEDYFSEKFLSAEYWILFFFFFLNCVHLQLIYWDDIDIIINNQTLVGFMQYMLNNVNTLQEKFAPPTFSSMKLYFIASLWPWPVTLEYKEMSDS